MLQQAVTDLSMRKVASNAIRAVLLVVGLLFALWAAFPTLRYWDGLPAQTRWLGALPLLSVSLFLSAALIAVLFV